MTRYSKNPNSFRRQRGIGVVFAMLGAVGLIAAVTYMISGVGMQTNSVSNTNKVSELVSQAQLIRQQVLLCAAAYPSGDNGTAFRVAYPGAVAAVDVTSLTCPGLSQSLWTGKMGAFLPRPPKGFNAWQYINDATSIRITITTTNLTGWGAAMTRAAAQIGPEASISGSTLTVTFLN